MTNPPKALVEALSKIMPIRVHDGQDYAEVFFADGAQHSTQAMTMNPQDWRDIQAAWGAVSAPASEPTRDEVERVEQAMEAETYRAMHQIATDDLGYPSILEALEAAPPARQSPAPVEGSDPAVPRPLCTCIATPCECEAISAKYFGAASPVTNKEQG